VTIVCRSHAEPSHPALRFVKLRPLAIGGAWRFWSFAKAVERHVEAAGYDVVYGLGRTWSQDVLRMGGGCVKTYLATAHDATRTPLERTLGLGKWKHRISIALEERALDPRGAGGKVRVIVNSEMVRRDVLERYALDPARVVTIHNGVDLERFSPRHAEPGGSGARLRAELGIGEEQPAVLFLGTGYARKGLDLVLGGFAEVLGREPRARLVVCGFDSDRARYEARARELGVDAAVRFLGGRLDPEAVYAACDLYVLPTRYDPFANSTLEALASGLPVITSLTNGGAELIAEGREGASVDVIEDGAEGRVARALVDWTDLERLREARGAARGLAERHGERGKFERAEAVLVEARRGG